MASAVPTQRLGIVGNVGFLSGTRSGGLRDSGAEASTQVRVKFEVCSGIVFGRAVTTSPSTGLEVAVPGRLDMFLGPEPQGTLILPRRSANLSVAPLAVV